MSSAAAPARVDYLYMYSGVSAGAGPLIATDMVNIISHAKIIDRVDLLDLLIIFVCLSVMTIRPLLGGIGI